LAVALHPAARRRQRIRRLLGCVRSRGRSRFLDGVLRDRVCARDPRGLDAAQDLDACTAIANGLLIHTRFRRRGVGISTLARRRWVAYACVSWCHRTFDCGQERILEEGVLDLNSQLRGFASLLELEE